MGQRFFFFFGMFMVVAFILLGIAILLKGNLMFPDMTAGIRIAFGCLLIIYGLFRSARYWKAIKEDNDDEDILDRQ